MDVAAPVLLLLCFCCCFCFWWRVICGGGGQKGKNCVDNHLELSLHFCLMSAGLAVSPCGNGARASNRSPVLMKDRRPEVETALRWDQRQHTTSDTCPMPSFPTSSPAPAPRPQCAFWLRDGSTETRGTPWSVRADLGQDSWISRKGWWVADCL